MALFQSLNVKFKTWLARKTEQCKNVTPLISNSYDRKLTLFEKMRVKLHLFTCGACLNYVSNLKFMHQVFRSQEENFDKTTQQVSLSPEASERIKNAIKNKI